MFAGHWLGLVLFGFNCANNKLYVGPLTVQPHTNLPPSQPVRHLELSANLQPAVSQTYFVSSLTLCCQAAQFYLIQNAPFVMKNSIWALYRAATHAHNYNSLEVGQIPFLLSDRKINLRPSVAAAAAAIDIKLRYSSSNPLWLHQPSVNQRGRVGCQSVLF